MSNLGLTVACKNTASATMPQSRDRYVLEDINSSTTSSGEAGHMIFLDHHTGDGILPRLVAAMIKASFELARMMDIFPQKRSTWTYGQTGHRKCRSSSKPFDRRK